MSIDRIKLFETVLNINEQGKASLTASERSIIEAETRDLLSAAGRKHAMVAPPGFDKLLAELKMAENPDDAYMMVSKFLESSGELGKPEPDLKPEIKPELPEPLPGPMDGLDAEPGLALGGPVEDKLDLEPPKLDLEPEKDSLLDKKEPSMPDFKDKLEDKKEEPKKEDKKEEPKLDAKPEDKKDEMKEDKSDKEAVLNRVAEMKEEEKKEEDKKEEKKEEDKKEEDKKEASLTQMGVKDVKTASKVAVRILGNRDILASFDGKPLFIATPKDKEDLGSVKRLANKVFGWIVYEGPKVAAAKCGTKLEAGVDEDVQPVFDEAMTPEATDPVTEEGDDLVKDAPQEPSSASPEGAEFNTKETYDTVTAGVEGDAEFVTDPAPDSKPESALAEEDTVHQESLDPPADASQEGAEVDFQSVEANLKRLYAAKAKKLAKEANEKFIKKFVKCVKLASTRMLLNYDENPYKAASMDVLANQQAFANGDEYTGMPQADAGELIEMIASAGQDEFVDLLLERTAGLMKKSDEYLTDLESDLGNLNIKQVEVSEEASREASEHKENLKTAAVEGNFQVNTGRPDTSTYNDNLVGGIRTAMGNTRLSKRSNALKRFKV